MGAAPAAHDISHKPRDLVRLHRLVQQRCTIGRLESMNGQPLRERGRAGARGDGVELSYLFCSTGQVVGAQAKGANRANGRAWQHGGTA